MFHTYRITKDLTRIRVRVADTLTQDARLAPPFTVGQRVDGFGGPYVVQGVELIATHASVAEAVAYGRSAR